MSWEAIPRPCVRNFCWLLGMLLRPKSLTKLGDDSSRVHDMNGLCQYLERKIGKLRKDDVRLRARGRTKFTTRGQSCTSAFTLVLPMVRSLIAWNFVTAQRGRFIKPRHLARPEPSHHTLGSVQPVVDQYM